MAGRSALHRGRHASDRSPLGARVHRSPDEAHAATRDGADQPLLVAIVADRPPRGVDAARQGGIRHDAAAPHRRDEIVLADDAVAVLHEMEKEIEYLRFDCNCCGATVQFAPVGIEHMIVKYELHARRLIRRNPARTINQGVLKDKSIIRQSLAARLQAFEGRSMKSPFHRREREACFRAEISAPLTALESASSLSRRRSGIADCAPRAPFVSEEEESNDCLQWTETVVGPWL